MKRVIGVYSGYEYPIDDYLDGKVEECRLIVPSYVGKGEAYSYVSNHRIKCRYCGGCPVKLNDIRGGYCYVEQGCAGDY